jgi:hypothetical protein
MVKDKLIGLNSQEFIATGLKEPGSLLVVETVHRPEKSVSRQNEANLLVG